mmetsp:Transcript_31472/g.50610  ORF Transcript_31472/g.50610 Transcript_31472/m.50610 type:complete len:301 (+) Transcript_31472:371-1273(+)
MVGHGLHPLLRGTPLLYGSLLPLLLWLLQLLRLRVRSGRRCRRKVSAAKRSSRTRILRSRRGCPTSGVHKIALLEVTHVHEPGLLLPLLICLGQLPLSIYRRLILLPPVQHLLFVAPTLLCTLTKSCLLPRLFLELALLLVPLLHQAGLLLLGCPPGCNYLGVPRVEELCQLSLRERSRLLNLPSPGHKDISEHLLLCFLVGVRLQLHFDTVDRDLRAQSNDGLSDTGVLEGHYSTAHRAVLAYRNSFANLFDSLAPRVIRAVDALQPLLVAFRPFRPLRSITFALPLPAPFALVWTEVW